MAGAELYSMVGSGSGSNFYFLNKKQFSFKIVVIRRSVIGRDYFH